LSDVPTNIDATAQDIALSNSTRFTRGWTLQELLAPTKLVLYDADWQLVGTRNEFVGKISEITKIDTSYLSSGASRIAGASISEKMSWASMRQTKRIEDTAYSLLGMFNINMPLLYGEGAKAFRRLQEEIIKQSADQSIFVWSQRSSEEEEIEEENSMLLAPLPKHFSDCGNIVRSINTRATKPYTITNIGLHAEFPILGRGTEVITVLNCRYGNDPFSDIGIWLCKDEDGRYRRSSRPLQKISTAYSRARLQQI
jgi:hypothetical protein